MGLIAAIDSVIKKIIFSIFWWLMDPLEPERLFSQLTDQLERNLDPNNPERLLAPDNFDVIVNNKVFIKHAHSIAKLETNMQDRLQRYVADRDYALSQALIKLQIISSATISRHNIEIHVRFSSEDEALPADDAKYELKITKGQGQGTSWKIKPGKTYHIGRVATADICLPYDNISKKQATLYFMPDTKITIVDEGSANGTFINSDEKPIKGSLELKIGDKIKFCNTNPVVMTLSEK